jgi:putative flippase GtrA
VNQAGDDGAGSSDRHGDADPHSADPRGDADRPGLILRLIKDQRIAFLFVGATNTGVGFLFFIFFDLTIGNWLDVAVNETIGSLATLACAHVLGVLFAFVMYRRFVFKVKGHVLRDLARFESVYLVAIVINAIILPILVNIGWNRILAQLSILVVTTLISWFGHKGFSFRRGEKELEAATAIDIEHQAPADDPQKNPHQKPEADR